MSALTVYDCSSVRAWLLCVCVKKWARSLSLSLSLPDLYPQFQSSTCWCPWQTEDVHSTAARRLLIHSHPLDEFTSWESSVSSPAATWNHGNLVRKLSRAVFSPPCFYSCLCRGGGGRGAGIGRNKVGNSFIWLVHDGVWMPAWPLPVCDSWHMAALYLHQPPSLRLRPLPSWLCTREAS